MTRSLTLTRHLNSVPNAILSRNAKSPPHPKTGPTAHILRLPTALTFFCEAGCAQPRTHAPVLSDDPPNPNLCQKSALTGTTVPPITR
ncbi:hypothetical protein C8J57DRAFT_1533423 [Mycena rebaudengoi]|nr:hypothetical protein C8J57DRAFT_1533423 [Mycena rebaudengoi]